MNENGVSSSRAGAVIFGIWWGLLISVLPVPTCFGCSLEPIPETFARKNNRNFIKKKFVTS